MFARFRLSVTKPSYMYWNTPILISVLRLISSQRLLLSHPQVQKAKVRQLYACVSERSLNCLRAGKTFHGIVDRRSATLAFWVFRIFKRVFRLTSKKVGSGLHIPVPPRWERQHCIVAKPRLIVRVVKEPTLGEVTHERRFSRICVATGTIGC